MLARLFTCHLRAQYAELRPPTKMRGGEIECQSFVLYNRYEMNVLQFVLTVLNLDARGYSLVADSKIGRTAVSCSD